MSITSPLVLKDASGSTSAPFVRLSASADESSWIMNTGDRANPISLRIRKSQSGSGLRKVDRYNVVIADTRTSTTNGGTDVASVSFTLSMPRSSAHNQQSVNDLVAWLTNLLLAGQLGTTGVTDDSTLEDVVLGVI